MTTERLGSRRGALRAGGAYPIKGRSPWTAAARLARAVIAAGILPALSASATVIEVPAQQATIQAGVDAAAGGDTVLVAPGRYEENVDFRGKGILLTSHYLLGGDSSFVRLTVIDGGHATDPDTASCVRFVSGEDSAAVLQGFMLTGGTGTTWVDPQWPSYTWRGGGGVFCFGSSPTIRCNLITGNHVDNDGSFDGAQGGGILCYDGLPRIFNNTIKANRADYGGGLVVDYAGALVVNNLICDNEGGLVYGGGGVWTIGSHPNPILLENNTLVGNSSPTRGGALYIWGSAVTARNNILWDNTQAQGGPIALVGGGTLDLTYSDIEGGFAGEGNLDAPPQFSDPVSYVLAPGSPCVDSAHPEPRFNDPEDPLRPGFALWPAQGALRSDMGVYGGPGCLAFEPGQAAVGEDPDLDLGPGSEAGRERGALQLRGGPNPTRGAAALEFTLAQESFVQVRIHGPTGALIRDLGRRWLPSGPQRVSWNGRDRRGRPVPSGLYTIRLQCGDAEARGRLTVLH